MTNLNNLKLDGKKMVEPAELVEFDDETAIEAAIASGAIEWGIFDDNGGSPDGSRWLLSSSDVVKDKLPEGAQVVRGYQINRYRAGNGNDYPQFCGFSSRDVAYTTSRETAVDVAENETAAEKGE